MAPFVRSGRSSHMPVYVIKSQAKQWSHKIMIMLLLNLSNSYTKCYISECKICLHSQFFVGHYIWLHSLFEIFLELARKRILFCILESYILEI